MASRMERLGRGSEDGLFVASVTAAAIHAVVDDRDELMSDVEYWAIVGGASEPARRVAERFIRDMLHLWEQFQAE